MAFLAFSVFGALTMKLINANAKPLSIETYIRLIISLLTIIVILIRHNSVVVFIRLSCIVLFYGSINGIVYYSQDEQLFERILLVGMGLMAMGYFFYVSKMVIKNDGNRNIHHDNLINGAT